MTLTVLAWVFLLGGSVPWFWLLARAPFKLRHLNRIMAMALWSRQSFEAQTRPTNAGAEGKPAHWIF